MQKINRHFIVWIFHFFQKRVVQISRSLHPFKGQGKTELSVAGPEAVLNYEGRAHLDNADFETMEVPLLTDQMRRARMSLERRIPALPDANPYLSSLQSPSEALGASKLESKQ